MEQRWGSPQFVSQQFKRWYALNSYKIEPPTEIEVQKAKNQTTWGGILRLVEDRTGPSGTAAGTTETTRFRPGS